MGIKKRYMSEVNIKLGTLLKKERERQKIEIDDLSERLKITVPYLQSIEAGTSEGLPSNLYFSLFAKSYAEALGIDYSRTVEAINADIEEAAEKPEKSKGNDKKQANSNGEESGDESQFFKKAGIILAVIVGLFIIFLGVNKFFFDTEITETTNNNTTETQANIETEDSKELEEAFNNYDWDNNEYTKPSKIILTLIPRQESWSAVFADGDTAIYRTLRVGRTYTAEADYRMIISVGIPSVVTVKLNGQEVDLRNEKSRRIFKVKIDQMNIDKFLNRNEESAAKEPIQKELAQENKPEQPVVTIDDSVSIENSETN